jgi:hypothetical protein
MNNVHRPSADNSRPANRWLNRTVLDPIMLDQQK